MEYQVTVGLEIHSELKTNSKMFCSCKNDPDEKRPNFNICPTCTAQPGTLPVANREAVRKVVKTGLALNCSAPLSSKFDRKNYFYPDLPKGYQISQYDKPLCLAGYLEIGGQKIRITRIHLEEDTGRLLHPEGADYSLVDYNRAGIPLMELVTEPDIKSGIEARKFAEELQLILRYLGVSDADMEKGQMRVEVNISLSKTEKLGTKIEIKNLNSFRSVEKSIDYEIERQAKILDESGKIIQETRGWNDARGTTVSQREKEEAHDYRYFPEPDLPTLHFDQKFIDDIKAEMPELPEQKRARMSEEFGLSAENTEIFVSNKNLGGYFEEVMSELANWIEDVEIKSDISNTEYKKLAKIASNYIISDLQGIVDFANFSEEKFPITPENFAEFVKMIYKGEISSKIAKMVLQEMYKTKADPSHIIEEKGLAQVSDEGEIEKSVREVIAKNLKPVEDYKKGKESALQFLVGQVMSATRGKAKPDIVQRLLKNILVP